MRARGAGGIEERSLEITSGSLRLPAGACIPRTSRGVVVLLHGIPSGAPPEPDDPGYPGLARRFASRGWAALWVRMRAAGAPGFFSIRGWVEDARAAVSAARALVPDLGGPLVLVGASAGGAVAVQIAGEGAPVDGLVLLAAPAEWMSFAGTPAEGLARITEDSGMVVADEVLADPQPWADEFGVVEAGSSIADVDLPVLIVHATDDDVVPIAHAHILHARAPRADLAVLAGGGHQLRRRSEVVPLVLDWLDDLFR
jgi:alpha-beta hydrolase superfamily lysophospholipase